MQGTMSDDAGEEIHVRTGWTISTRGQESTWKSQSE